MNWICLFLLVLVVLGLPFRVRVNTFCIPSEKIQAPVRIAVLCDLHDSRYGKNMKSLVTWIQKTRPDLILMPGDMSEIGHRQKNMCALLEGLKDFPCFYSTGNHEEHDDDLNKILELVADTGVHVLNEKAELFEANGTVLEIAGLRAREEEEDYRIEEVTSLYHTDAYRILLSHRPHWTDLYAKSTADLVVCGHAHGGQWMIPIAHRGIVAPGQGLFPKYTHGVYDAGAVKIAVSKGLARFSHGIVRLYNDPEIMILELEPTSKDGDKIC